VRKTKKSKNQRIIGCLWFKGYRELLDTYNFHSGFEFMCERRYDDMMENVERILREEVRITFYQALKRDTEKIDENERNVFANMVSWIIYGAAFDWRAQTYLSAEKYYENICQTFQLFLQEKQIFTLK
jgi:hypothetical protein